jgi:hypothetical protein
MNDERRIFLGVIETEPGESLAIDIPPDADAAVVQEAIIAANLERERQRAEESRRLRELFCLPDASSEVDLS